MKGLALIPFTEEKRTAASLGFGHGWCKELDRAWQNGFFAVMSRDIQTASWTHLFIRNREGCDISWADKQIIKNRIAGPDKTAIEVFPAIRGRPKTISHCAARWCNSIWARPVSAGWRVARSLVLRP